MPEGVGFLGQFRSSLGRVAAPAPAGAAFMQFCALLAIPVWRVRDLPYYDIGVHPTESVSLLQRGINSAF
jgi:hypothetical protein